VHRFLRMRLQRSCSINLSYGLSNSWRHFGVHRGALHWRRLENPLAVNVYQHANAKHTRGQVRTSITDKRQRESLVRQKRRRHTDVDCCLQRKERNDPAAEQQSKTITSVQRNHDAANNYHNEQKNHQKTEPHTKFFADDWKNKIGVRVRQIEHLLPAITSSE